MCVHGPYHVPFARPSLEPRDGGEGEAPSKAQGGVLKATDLTIRCRDNAQVDRCLN